MFIQNAGELLTLDLIGEGACGRVYLAEDEEGTPYALKQFHASAVNLPLLERMTRRLCAGGWPTGVMPVTHADFGKSPAIRVCPFVGDAGDGSGEALPSSLQHMLEKHPGPATSILVQSLARALAGMHERGVAHGNLKPGNIFIDAAGEVLLADWTLGNMPDVSVFHFTDAVLYQPPEQLRDATGYATAAGFRWDVFAFGVLSYRLLTGCFPRCHDIYQRVAPKAGSTRRDDLQVDLSKVAKNLEMRSAYEWPDAAVDKEELGLRKWLDRCLSLDPEDRPADMACVLAGFEEMEATFAESRTGDLNSAGAMAERWSHARHIVSDELQFSRDGNHLSEWELWGFDEEIEAIEFHGIGLSGTEESSEVHRSPLIAADESPGVVSAKDPMEETGNVAMGNTESDVSSHAEPANTGLPAVQETVPPQSASWGNDGVNKAEHAPERSEFWLESEFVDGDASTSHKRRSGIDRRSVRAGIASSKPAGPRNPRWSISERLGLLVLVGLLLIGGGLVFWYSIYKLPGKPDVWQRPGFPVSGERIMLESASCYWRAPVTEGEKMDVCRRGTMMLPVIELSVSGGDSTIRAIFRNQEGMPTGDPVIRTVHSGDLVRITGTAGLEDAGAWAAYRIGGQEPWSVQIHEILADEKGGVGPKRLLNLNIPGSMR